MRETLLLDTCAVIWVSSDEAEIAAEALDALGRAQEVGESIYVSPISAWELGLLVARGRLSLLMSPERWFERLLQAPGIGLADMPPEVLIASSFLPGEPPRDPADRIIAATAREFGYTLVTRDKPLLAYASQGHVRAICC
ncbi:MAG: type II toxin-antitoxin system VapC family toxin [Xanthobacteraceae bacterium]